MPYRQSSYSPQPKPTNSPQFPSPQSPVAQLRLNNHQHYIRQSKSWQEDSRRGSNDSSGSSTKVSFSLGDSPVNKNGAHDTASNSHGQNRHSNSRTDSGVDLVTPSPDQTDTASGPWTKVDRSKPSQPVVGYRPRSNTGHTYRPRSGQRGGRGFNRSLHRGGGLSR